jgi:glycosyltransferase involved in cell wall biosynthesis
MNNTNAFVFIGGNKILEGLYVSHNVNFLKNLMKSQQLNCRDYYMLGYASDELYNNNKIDFDAINQDLYDFAGQLGYNFQYERIPERNIKSLKKTIKYLRTTLKDYDRIVVWHHNLFGALIATRLKKNLKNVYIHSDLKGIAPEEELHYSEKSYPRRFLNYSMLKSIEKFILPKVDSISVVSYRFADHISIISGKPRDAIYTIPSVFYQDQFFYDDEIRNKYRNKLGIDTDEKLVFYSGGLQKYQSVDNIFKFFKNIESYEGVRTLLLVVDKEKTKRYFEKYGLKKTIIISAKGDDVNGYYNAADIGVAFRSEDIVSKVSCPTKIPEYIATKNSIILHENIGDFGLMLKGTEFAIVKKNNKAMVNITAEELFSLKNPSEDEIDSFASKYSISESMKKNEALFRRLNMIFTN